MVNGIYNMSDEDYRAAAGHNYSSVKHAAKSAAHYLEASKNPRPPTAAMLIGSCLDSLVLDGDKCWQAAEDGIKAETKSGKALERCRAGELVLSPELDAMLTGMARMVESHADSKAVLRACDQRKAAVFAEIDGCQCKGQLDAYGLGTDGRPIICDLKKIQDATRFAQDVAKFQWHLQAGLYAELVRIITGVEPSFLWIAVEEKPPHGVIVYQATSETLAAGLAAFRRCLDTVRRAEALGEWAGYEPGIRELNLPLWAMQ